MSTQLQYSHYLWRTGSRSSSSHLRKSGRVLAEQDDLNGGAAIHPQDKDMCLWCPTSVYEPITSFVKQTLEAQEFFVNYSSSGLSSFSCQTRGTGISKLGPVPSDSELVVFEACAWPSVSSVGRTRFTLRAITSFCSLALEPPWPKMIPPRAIGDGLPSAADLLERPLQCSSRTRSSRRASRSSSSGVRPRNQSSQPVNSP